MLPIRYRLYEKNVNVDKLGNTDHCTFSYVHKASRWDDDISIIWELPFVFTEKLSSAFVSGIGGGPNEVKYGEWAIEIGFSEQFMRYYASIIGYNHIALSTRYILCVAVNTVPVPCNKASRDLLAQSIMVCAKHREDEMRQGARQDGADKPSWGLDALRWWAWQCADVIVGDWFFRGGRG